MGTTAKPLHGVSLDLKVTFQGSEEVERQLHMVITRALKLAMDDTIDYMNIIVPESAAAFFRYGPGTSHPKYKSEELLTTAIDLLRAAVTGMVRRKMLLDEYQVPIRFPASYAGYVNEAQTTGVWKEEGDTGWSQRGWPPGHHSSLSVAVGSRGGYCLRRHAGVRPVCPVLQADTERCSYSCCTILGGLCK